MIHDFQAVIRDLKDYQQNLMLHPQTWTSFQPVPPLAWNSVRFDSSQLQSVPASRGIYAFVVQFQDHSTTPLVFPPHGFIMYAGITGAKAQNRTLRARCRDYLREKGKRVQIWSMLEKWKGHLFFHFSVVDTAHDLAALEVAFNDAVLPPFVTRDFSAEVRKRVRVLRHN